MKKKYGVVFHDDLFVYCGKRSRFMVAIKDVLKQDEQEEKEMVEDQACYISLYMR